MIIEKNRRCRSEVASIVTFVLLALPLPGFADEFERTLAQVDRALAKNPTHVVEHALRSCANRRTYAAKLYYAGHVARAERSLKYCVKLLRISAIEPKPKIDRSKQRANS
ncbi:unnamed protein product, partial [marine sediment metagenome]